MSSALSHKNSNYVEIKTTQMRTGTIYPDLFKQKKKVNHHHLHLAETQWQAEEKESFRVEIRLQVCLVWAAEAG